MPPILLLLVLLFALSIATLLGAIFDGSNRAAFSISTILAHALLISVGYVASRRRGVR